MRKAICLAVGGTGGHVLPALRLADQLKKQGIDTIFLGVGLGANRFFQNREYTYFDVKGASLSLKNPLKLVRSSLLILWGIIQSISLFRKYPVMKIVGFGSYHSFPPLVAAILTKTPYLLYEPNAIAGKVNRLLSKWAQVGALQFKTVASALDCPCEIVDADSLIATRAKKERSDILTYFDLEENKNILLVFGGSLGADSINQLLFDAAKSLASLSISIIHITGSDKWTDRLKSCYAKWKIMSCVKAYEPNMPYAWEIASLAVCRAGASTLQEASHFSVPSILIPFPGAMDNHQEVNAVEFTKSNEGSLWFKEKDLDFIKLTDIIGSLLHDSKRLDIMKSSLHPSGEKRKSLFELVLES